MSEFRELRYLDTCLPGYFQGFSGHVYAVPVSAEDTYKTVLEGLMRAVLDEEIYGFEDNYAKIENDVRGFIHHARETGKLNSPWSNFLEDGEENSETCYAYFGVVMA